jgi:hypothetical protein
MTGLSDLAPLAPSADVDRRVRARCHAAMRVPGRRRGSTRLRRLIDAGLVAGVALYGASTAIEALRIILFTLE